MGSARQEGSSEGRGLGWEPNRFPGALVDRESAGPVPFRSFMPLPHRIPQGLPHHRWTPKCGWVPLGVGTHPLPQPPLRGAGPRGLAFNFAPHSLPPSPSGPAWLEGPSVGRGSGLGSQQVPGVHLGRRNLVTLPFDPLPSKWSPNFPLRVWDPFPSPSCPSGVPVLSHLHFSSPFTLPTSHVLPGYLGFLLSP